VRPIARRRGAQRRPRRHGALPGHDDARRVRRLVDRIEAAFEERGFALWAVEVAGDGGFAGFVGLSPCRSSALHTGGRGGLAPGQGALGRGYATEGARAVVAFGFEEVGLEEIVSFTAPVNVRSWRVMERLGMTRDPADDFDHPAVPRGTRSAATCCTLARRDR